VVAGTVVVGPLDVPPVVGFAVVVVGLTVVVVGLTVVVVVPPPFFFVVLVVFVAFFGWALLAARATPEPAALVRASAAAPLASSLRMFIGSPPGMPRWRSHPRDQSWSNAAH